MFFILTFFFVPKIDDIIFNLNEFFQFKTFKEFLYETIYYGNGRYLGNGLALLFSKIPKVFYIIEFILVQIFCFSAEKLIGIKNSKLFFLTAFLLQPIQFVNQITSWICGFINYFIPIELLIFLILIIKSYKKELSVPVKIGRCFILALLGFCEQLFVQHNAVMNIVIIVTVIFCLKKDKKSIYESVIVLIANIIGAVLLFGYNSYIDMTKMWTYQTGLSSGTTQSLKFALYQDSLKSFIKNIVSNTGVFIFCFLGCIFLYSVLIYIVVQVDKEEKLFKHKGIIYFFNSMFYIASAFTVILNFLDKLAETKYVIIVSVIFGLSLVGNMISLIKLFKHFDKKLIIIVCVMFLYGVAAYSPFIVYNARGAFRGCEFFYIMFTFATLLIFNSAVKKYNLNPEKPCIAVCAFAMAVTIAYTVAYARECKIYDYKIEHYKTNYYLPKGSRILVDQNTTWEYAEGNIEHEFICYKEFKALSESDRNK